MADDRHWTKRFSLDEVLEMVADATDFDTNTAMRVDIATVTDKGTPFERTVFGYVILDKKEFSIVVERMEWKHGVPTG